MSVLVQYFDIIKILRAVQILTDTYIYFVKGYEMNDK